MADEGASIIVYRGVIKVNEYATSTSSYRISSGSSVSLDVDLWAKNIWR